MAAYGGRRSTESAPGPCWQRGGGGGDDKRRSRGFFRDPPPPFPPPLCENFAKFFSRLLPITHHGVLRWSWRRCTRNGWRASSRNDRVALDCFIAARRLDGKAVWNMGGAVIPGLLSLEHSDWETAHQLFTYSKCSTASRPPSRTVTSRPCAGSPAPALREPRGDERSRAVCAPNAAFRPLSPSTNPR